MYFDNYIQSNNRHNLIAWLVIFILSWVPSLLSFYMLNKVVPYASTIHDIWLALRLFTCLPLWFFGVGSLALPLCTMEMFERNCKVYDDIHYIRGIHIIFKPYHTETLEEEHEVVKTIVYRDRCENIEKRILLKELLGNPGTIVYNYTRKDIVKYGKLIYHI